MDVGAHHPRRLSNTYFFYKRGWSGINIEPNPTLIRVFNSERNRDINLQCGVAEREGVLRYYVFDEPALNTFDSGLVKHRLENTPYKDVGETDVAVERLDVILASNLPSGVQIDFLSVDVEGLDLSVLKSNNWQLFRPAYVLTEVLAANLEEASLNPVCLFMQAHGYCLFAKTYNTFIFKDLEV